MEDYMTIAYSSTISVAMDQLYRTSFQASTQISDAVQGCNSFGVSLIGNRHMRDDSRNIYI